MALTFDYSPTMVQAIKDGIPSRQRTWKGDIKQWWFKQEAHTSMLTLAERHCGSVQHVQENGDLAPAIPAYRTLHLLPSAPDELVKHAYRVMCKIHHPDKGGTREKCSASTKPMGSWRTGDRRAYLREKFTSEKIIA